MVDGGQWGPSQYSLWKDALDSGTVAEGVPSGKAKGEAVNGKELGEVRLWGAKETL